MSRMQPAPRDYNTGAPRDRLAAIAARRAFVSLKLTFVDAVAALDCTQAQWLSQQVRAAEEPVDLWMLRAPMFRLLAGNAPGRREVRQRLRRALEAVFAEPQHSTTFAAV